MFDAAGAAYAACKASLDVWEAAAAGASCNTLHVTQVTRGVLAEADGDVQAHGGGGGSAAAPVHRKTRI